MGTTLDSVQFSRLAASTAQLLNGREREKFARVVMGCASADDLPERYRGWLVDHDSIPNDCRSLGHQLASPKAVIPDVTKAGRNAVDRALTRLDELPDAEPGLIAVPWPRRERPKVPNEAWADSSLRLWPIESLCATQRFVKRDTVKWHLENLGIVREGAHSNPNVLVVEGEPRIYDGHHRLVALWLLYVVATNCWTLEIE